MKPKLIIVTGNPLKFRELSASLGEFFDCEQRKLDGYEIQGSPQEILRHKLARAYEAFKEPVLVDDTSLHLAALKGFPGPYIRGFFECMTPYEMGTRFADTRIKVTCRLGVCRTPDDIVIAEGTIHGTVIAPKDNDHKGT